MGCTLRKTTPVNFDESLLRERQFVTLDKIHYELPPEWLYWLKEVREKHLEEYSQQWNNEHRRPYDPRKDDYWSQKDPLPDPFHPARKPSHIMEDEETIKEDD